MKIKKSILLPINKYFDWRDRRWRKHYSEYSKEELIEEVVWEKHQSMTAKAAYFCFAILALILIAI